MTIFPIISKRKGEILELYNDIENNEEYLTRLEELCKRLVNLNQTGGKALIFGNGGSHCQSSHLATELLIRYKANSQRPALPAVCISSDSGVVTAAANDFSFTELFSRQLEILTQPNDVIIGFSTSGKSRNFIDGIKSASKKVDKSSIFAFVGSKNISELEMLSTVIWNPNAISTAACQEFHLFSIHCLCELMEGHY